MPGSGPPDPTSQTRFAAIWQAAQDGSLPSISPPVTLSAANVRALQSCPSPPVHGVVILGGFGHVLLEFGDGSGLLAVPR